MTRKNQKTWKGKTAVITGASSGIGSAIAQQFARHGLRVVLSARRQARLNEVKARIEAEGGEAVIVSADLEKESERQLLYQQSLALGDVDVLVNNAGFGWYGFYHDMSWDTAQSMIRLNVEAVAHLTSLFLQQMIARRAGYILNIGSIAGVFPNQGTAAYSASKAYVTAFSTALHRELRYSGIHVSLLLPGAVATAFFDQASETRGSLRIPAERLAVSVDRVALRAWDALLRPRRVVYIPWWLGVVPWAELGFGWIIDRLGPLLLKRNPTS